MMLKYLLTLGVVSSALCITGFGQTSNEGNTVVAEIDGNKLTLSEFEKMRPTGLFHARNTFYEGQKKAVEEFITDYLVERQARKENLTVTQLYDKYVTKTIAADPSDEALRVYWEGLDNPQPFEQVKAQILTHIRQLRIDRAKKAYIDGLRVQAKVAITIAPPRANIDLKDTPVRGPAGAPVTIIEYADYECPYCQQAQPTVEKIEAAYKGKIAFAFKDTPLPMHAHAQKAAEAARCAGLQNKYWEFHDSLFKTKQLDLPQLKEQARSLNLDAASFDQCLDSGAEADKVKATLAEGAGLKIEGTPSYYINGRFFAGNVPFDQMAKAIDEELSLAAARPKETATLK